MPKQKIELEVDVPEGQEVWNVATVSSQSWADCRITFKPVVKYRDVTADDVGREVEVSDDKQKWVKRTLIAALPPDLYCPFVTRQKSGTVAMGYRFARIVDDGAKPKREWWIVNNFHAYECEQTGSDGKPVKNQVHVREV